MSRSYLLFLVLVCAVRVPSQAPIPPQRSWLVDNTGSSESDFTDLVSAYRIVRAGDTLLVQGSPSPYWLPALMDKPIRIVGIGASSPLVYCPPTTIRIPAGELLLLDNLELGLGVFVEDCRGRVILSQIRGGWSAPAGIATRRSAPVFVVDSRLIGFLSPVIIPDSETYLQNCEAQTLISGASFGSPPRYAPVMLRQAASPIADQTFIIGGFYQGGEGSCGYDHRLGPIGYAGGPAVSGHLVLSGPGVFRAGTNPGAPYGCQPVPQRAIWGCVANPPIIIPLTIDPMVVGNYVCERPGQLVVREMPAVLPQQAQRNAPQTIDMWGPTHGVVALFASFAHARDPIELPIGKVWLDPSLVVCVGATAVDQRRHATLTTRIPDWLSIGDVLVYQVVSTSPTSTLEISAPGYSVVH
jgi:hypothetical protein